MTNVTFPSGDVTANATVTALAPELGAVITDTTPFHPVDHTWPDQPADTGSIDAEPVSDVVMAARSADGEWMLGESIPVRRGTEGWQWAVAHIVPNAALFEVGQSVVLTVDADRRLQLSMGHTACHLASLALNAALTRPWSCQPGPSREETRWITKTTIRCEVPHIRCSTPLTRPRRRRS